MQPASMPPSYGQVIIIKDYGSKQKTAKTSRPAASEEYLISPLTGERIAASKIQQHMRIGLLDPRWMEQRYKDVHTKSQVTVLALGSAIEDSLKQLAERRTDIFGVGDEETSIGKKIGEEDKKKDDNVTWDGHMSSVEAATRAARVNIPLEEQIHQIHKMKGLVSDKEKIGPKPVTRPSELLYYTTAASNYQLEPPMMTMAPVPRILTSAKSPFMWTAPPKEEELSLKKFRTEDSFITEQQFLDRNTGN
ncbi:splicing factor 3A subunit 1-like isoform X2 [Belonocnema kinseyi]|nr:splicing factor 3A subunit 1-like isoform X2 [Belonocnema kinseyi]